MRDVHAIAAVSAMLALGAPLIAGGLLDSELVTDEVVVPTFIEAVEDDEDRLYIGERDGLILLYRLDTETMNATPFLDITTKVLRDGAEQGLLSMAFHPDYDRNGRFFISYSVDPGGETVVEEYVRSVDPEVADPTPVQQILTVPQIAHNHNTAWLGFKDELLYVVTGDGGGPSFDGQDLTVLRGKVLRIDVDADDFPADPLRNYAIPADNPLVGSGVAEEIWAYGLRHPWRCDFDEETGDLYIGDVGRIDEEEVSVIDDDADPLQNLGWRCVEGNFCLDTPGCDCDDPDLLAPIHTYDHSVGCAIIGGVVYRGEALPQLDGHYFFAEYCFGRVSTLKYVPGVGATELTNRTTELQPSVGSLFFITTFGSDAAGEVYFGTQNGRLYKIVGTPVPPPCLGDCAPPGGNEIINIDDLVAVVNAISTQDLDCDVAPANPDGTVGNGVINFDDIVTVVNNFGPC